MNSIFALGTIKCHGEMMHSIDEIERELTSQLVIAMFLKHEHLHRTNIKVGGPLRMALVLKLPQSTLYSLARDGGFDDDEKNKKLKLSHFVIVN